MSSSTCDTESRLLRDGVRCDPRTGLPAMCQSCDWACDYSARSQGHRAFVCQRWAPGNERIAELGICLTGGDGCPGSAWVEWDRPACPEFLLANDEYWKMWPSEGSREYLDEHFPLPDTPDADPDRREQQLSEMLGRAYQRHECERCRSWTGPVHKADYRAVPWVRDCHRHGPGPKRKTASGYSCGEWRERHG